MIEDRKKYKKEHYLKNRDHYTQYRRDRYDRIKNYLRDFKESVGCRDCKISDWRVLEFDHLRDKKFGFARAHDYSFDDVLLEIEKCEVVCANCHKIRTLNREHDRLPDLQRRTKRKEKLLGE